MFCTDKKAAKYSKNNSYEQSARKNPLSRLLIYPDCFISLYLNSGKASPTINIKANEPHKHLFFFNRKKLEKAMEKELLRVADYSAVDAAIAKANGLEKKDVNQTSKPNNHTNNNEKAPTTADTNDVMGYMIVCISALLMTGLLYSKRKQRTSN